MDGILAALLKPNLDEKISLRENMEHVGFYKVGDYKTRGWNLTFNDWDTFPLDSMLVIGCDKDFDRNLIHWGHDYRAKKDSEKVSIYYMPLEKVREDLACLTSKVKTGGGEIEIPFRFRNSSFFTDKFERNKVILGFSVENDVTVPMELMVQGYFTRDNKRGRGSGINRIALRTWGQRFQGKIPDKLEGEITAPFSIYVGRGETCKEYVLTNHNLEAAIEAQKKFISRNKYESSKESKVLHAKRFVKKYRAILKGK